MNSTKFPAIYMMTNKWLNILYIGVTSDLIGRVYDHKLRVNTKSFTYRYNCEYLVYYEFYDTMEVAIEREKSLKNRSRRYKNALVESLNPNWRDLYDEMCAIHPYG